MESIAGNGPLLEVRGLRTRFFTYEGVFDAVNGIDLEVDNRESVGIVGETGCGKSVTALSIMRLIKDPPGKIVAGSVLFKGQDLLKKSPDEMREVLGAQIAMIFQKAMSSLNPTFKIGEPMADIISLHQKVDKKTAWARAVAILKSVRLAAPEKLVNCYPHELSGGMRQRVVIATALSSKPDLLIADEPTTALDATIQKQILGLIQDLRREFGFSMLFISHDLRTVYKVCDRIYVMYAGNVVEHGPIEEVFSKPGHPYFRALVNSLPRFDSKIDMLADMPGTVPSLINPPPGCRFHPRCPGALEICSRQIPALEQVGPRHWAACFRAREG
jgi:oligopeptide transport system ATP-binding protein